MQFKGKAVRTGELCDDIGILFIDTVQLANFKNFQWGVKDSSVSVAKTYTTDVNEWIHVGSYKAKNFRRRDWS